MQNRDRSYYRIMRKRKIHHRKRLVHELGDYWVYQFDGQLSKGKIHCSCGMCMAKTRNKKYRRRHIHGNYAPNINYKRNDLQKMQNMDAQELDLYEFAEKDGIRLVG